MATEKRPIDANALLNLLKKFKPSIQSPLDLVGMIEHAQWATICGAIVDAPTMDVVDTDELASLQALNAAMAAALKNSGGCGNCRYCHAAWNEEPCDSCRQDPSFPKWEWNGCIKGGKQNGI